MRLQLRSVTQCFLKPIDWELPVQSWEDSSHHDVPGREFCQSTTFISKLQLFCSHVPDANSCSTNKFTRKRYRNFVYFSFTPPHGTNHCAIVGLDRDESWRLTWFRTKVSRRPTRSCDFERWRIIEEICKMMTIGFHSSLEVSIK